jgi:hypothetical protein
VKILKEIRDKTGEGNESWDFFLQCQASPVIEATDFSLLELSKILLFLTPENGNRPIFRNTLNIAACRSVTS